MQDWITVKQLADLQGITPRAVRKSVEKNKYVTRLVEFEKGNKYEILVESLDDNTKKLIDFEKSKSEIEKNREPSLRKNNIIPVQAQKIALARFDLINLWVNYKKMSDKKTEAGKEFINSYNTGKPYSYLYSILGNVSIGTIYRWSKELKHSEDYLQHHIMQEQK